MKRKMIEDVASRLTFSGFLAVEIPTKSSPISYGRRDRGKFITGTSRHPAKHDPVRVPELEKKLRAVYQE